MNELNAKPGKNPYRGGARPHISILRNLLVVFLLWGLWAPGASVYAQGLAIQNLELWVADVDVSNPANRIQALAEQDTIDLEATPSVSIIATIDDPDGEFSKVEFYIDDQFERAEAGVPLALKGDRFEGGDNMLNVWNVSAGEYIVRAVPLRGDGSAGAAFASTITVVQNLAPEANDLNLQTPNGQALNIDLSTEVADADGSIDWSSLSVESSVGGTSTIDGQGLVFTPTRDDAMGEIRYRVQDNQGKWSNTGTITITIGNYHTAPSLSDISVSTEVNTPVNLDVLAYASDPDGIDPNSIVIESAPATGSATVTGGQVVYNPATDYNGTETFTVTVADLNRDPKRSREATVTVVVGSQGLISRYDRYEPTVAGVWRYEIVRPEYRFPLSDLASLYADGPAINVEPSMTAAELESIIQNAPNGSRVVFASGVYNINDPLNISRGNIRLESNGRVVLDCTFGGSWNRYGLSFRSGGGTGTNTNITGGLENEHTYILQVQSSQNFAVGDWVRVVAYATAKSYPSGNQVNLPNGREVHRMATLCKVVAKPDGATLELDRKPAFPPGWIDYPEYAQVQQWRLLENIAVVGDFTISYTNMLGEADSGDNGNDNSWSQYAASVAGFNARNVANLAMVGVKTENTPSASMWINHCVDVYMESCGSYGAHNRGSGGQGYAMLHEGCTNMQARDWYDERMRHSWATSLNTSSVALDVEITYTESNPEFSHGGFDRLQSFRVQEISPHQDGERYRIFDHREVKVLSRNVGWVGTFSGRLPFGEYDHSLRTLPGQDANYDLRNLGSDHKPGFRDAPNAYYQTFAGLSDAGFNTLYIIGMGHGSRIVVNPGTHSFNLNNPRGNVFFVSPNAGSTPTVATVSGFRTRAERVRRADLIIIPQMTGINGFADLDISGERNAVIRLPDGGSITLNGIPASAISENHVKVMSVARMDRIHHRMGVQYQFKGDDPYVERTLVDLGGVAPRIKQVWNRPVEWVGGNNGVWLTPQGNTVEAITTRNTTISGDTVIYTLSNASKGDRLKLRMDPGFFRDEAGNSAQGIYDWHESVNHNTAFYSEAVLLDESFNEDGFIGAGSGSSSGDEGGRGGTFPVELLYFRAEANPYLNQVDLTWETASELNNDYFVVERSLDGSSFESMVQVAGGGTTQSRQRYETADTDPRLGKAFYRLRQIDLDGSFTYSPVVEVTFSVQDLSRVKLYPVPAPVGENITAEFFIPNAEQVAAEVLDARGKIVHLGAAEAVSGNGTLQLSTQGLMPGLYFVRVYDVDQPDVRVSGKLQVQP